MKTAGMMEAIKDVYEKLNDEQKKKVDECRSEEDLMDLFSEWGLELPDDLVEAAGGGIYYRPQCEIQYQGVH